MYIGPSPLQSRMDVHSVLCEVAAQKASSIIGIVDHRLSRRDLMEGMDINNRAGISLHRTNGSSIITFPQLTELVSFELTANLCSF